MSEEEKAQDPEQLEQEERVERGKRKQSDFKHTEEKLSEEGE